MADYDLEMTAEEYARTYGAAPTQDYDLEMTQEEYDRAYGAVPTLGSELKAVAGRGAQGIFDLASFANMLNPVSAAQAMTAKITGAPTVGDEATQQMAELREATGTNLSPETVAGQFAGQLAYYTPQMFGAGGPIRMAAAAAPMALGAGTVEALGGDEQAQAMGGLIGGVGLPLAVRGIQANIPPLTARKAAATQLAETDRAAIEALATKADDPFYQFTTTAEATQSPKLAALQETVTKSASPSSRVQELFATNESLRRAEHKKLLQELTGLPVQGKEEGGQMIRDLLSREKGLIDDTVKASYEEARKLGNVEVPRAPLLKWIGDTKNTYKAGVPKSVRSELFSEILAPSHATGKVGEKGKFATLDYLDSLRKKASNLWTKANIKQDKETAAIARDLINRIDDSIATTSPQAASAIEKAREQFAYGKQVFGKEGVGKVLRKELTEFKIPAEKVPNVVWDGTKDSTRRLLRAVGSQPADVQRAKSVIRDRILRESLDKDELISPGKFKTNLLKYQDSLTTSFKGRRLFSKKEFNELKLLADDLDLINPASMKSVNRLANLASKGQPTTAQAWLRSMATVGKWGATATTTPGVIIGHMFLKVLEKAGLNRKEAINEILGQALLDKEFAKTLIKEAKPSALLKLSEDIGVRFPAISSSMDTSMQDGKPTEKKTEPLEIPAIEPEPVSFGGFDLEKTLDAIRQVESGGGKFLKSPAGALGPYQFMPATAKAYGLDDPMDEEASREAARRLLQDELQALGDPLLAFAAYNAGRSAVLRAIEKAGTKNWVQVKNHLPAETRDYVPKVLRLIA